MASPISLTDLLTLYEKLHTLSTHLSSAVLTTHTTLLSQTESLSSFLPALQTLHISLQRTKSPDAALSGKVLENLEKMLRQIRKLLRSYPVRQGMEGVEGWGERWRFSTEAREKVEKLVRRCEREIDMLMKLGTFTQRVENATVVALEEIKKLEQGELREHVDFARKKFEKKLTRVDVGVEELEKNLKAIIENTKGPFPESVLNKIHILPEIFVLFLKGFYILNWLSRLTNTAPQNTHSNHGALAVELLANYHAISRGKTVPMKRQIPTIEDLRNLPKGERHFHVLRNKPIQRPSLQSQIMPILETDGDEFLVEIKCIKPNPNPYSQREYFPIQIYRRYNGSIKISSLVRNPNGNGGSERTRRDVEYGPGMIWRLTPLHLNLSLSSSPSSSESQSCLECLLTKTCPRTGDVVNRELYQFSNLSDLRTFQHALIEVKEISSDSSITKLQISPQRSFENMLPKLEVHRSVQVQICVKQKMAPDSTHRRSVENVPSRRDSVASFETAGTAASVRTSFSSASIKSELSRTPTGLTAHVQPSTTSLNTFSSRRSTLPTAHPKTVYDIVRPTTSRSQIYLQILLNHDCLLQDPASESEVPERPLTVLEIYLDTSSYLNRKLCCGKKPASSESVSVGSMAKTGKKAIGEVGNGSKSRARNAGELGCCETLVIIPGDSTDSYSSSASFSSGKSSVHFSSNGTRIIIPSPAHCSSAYRDGLASSTLPRIRIREGGRVDGDAESYGISYLALSFGDVAGKQKFAKSLREVFRALGRDVGIGGIEGF